MSNLGNVLKYLGAVTAASSPAKTKEEQKPGVKATIGPVRVQPQMKATIGPIQMQPQMTAAVGPVQMSPQQAMQELAPKAPGQGQMIPGTANNQILPILFSQFHKMVGGDRQMAETVLPGITDPAKAATMLKPGPNGQLQVQVPAQAVKALQAQQKVPAAVSPEDFARAMGVKSFAEFMKDPAKLQAAFPGGDEQGGMVPFLRRGPNGEGWLINPQSPEYQKLIKDATEHAAQRDVHYQKTDEELSRGQK